MSAKDEPGGDWESCLQITSSEGLVQRESSVELSRVSENKHPSKRGTGDLNTRFIGSGVWMSN